MQIERICSHKSRPPLLVCLTPHHPILGVKDHFVLQLVLPLLQVGDFNLALLIQTGTMAAQCNHCNKQN